MKLIEDYSSFLSTLKVVSRDKNSQISLIEDDTKESNHSYQPSDSLDKMTMKLKKLSKKDELDQYPKKFDSRRYINQFYKNVYTIDIKVFKKKFMDILFSSKVPV